MKQTRLYIKAENIKKSFKEHLILEFDRLWINEGDRIGLVGLNGEGKTTLLNLLYGSIAPENGSITRYADIAYYRQFEQEQANKNLSGGENTKLRLSKAIRKDALVTFFDEPTSNLDQQGRKSLKHTLSQLKTFVIVTHERELLDEFCNRILEVSNHTITAYKGNYSQYKEQKEKLELTKLREYEAYVDEKKHLQNVFEEKKQLSVQVGKQPRNISPREARLRNFLASRPYDGKQQRVERSAKAALSRMEHLEVKEKPRQVPKIAINFALTNPPENKRVLEGRNVTYCYGANKVLDKVQFSILNGHRYAIIGDNGAGKTTLLNCITNGEDGVYIVPKAKLGYLYQQFEGLLEDETVYVNMMKDCIQEESIARSILSRLLLGEHYMKQKVATLSGGEKMKLALGKLLVSDANVLLLDEPTNYLDMPSVEAISEVLKEYEGTLLLVSHDKSLIGQVATDILAVNNHKVTQFAGSYKDYAASLTKNKTEDALHIQKEALEMELLALISKLSTANAKEKDTLEPRYQQLLSTLKQLNQ
ncbi:MAG: ABC-F family ATP-binding cassette domain-containing protein [bacterium]|nr:ABC-F family ATP-binding cassette domain-containing protein [bacterium]